MTIDAAEISRRAHRQLDIGRVSVHITAEQVAGLADAYRALRRRLAEIEGRARRAQYILVDGNQEDARSLLVSIEEIAKTGP